MKRIAAAISLLATSLTSVAAASETGFFAPEVDGEVWADISKYREPSLFKPGALDGYRSRFRLSISGISCREVVIRIDERDDGSIRGRKVTGNKCQGRRSDYVTRNFTITAAQMLELRNAMADAALWTYFPEFWASKNSDEICLDGNQLVFERANRDGYRISLANAQCTTTPKLRAVAEKFIEIAHADSARELLK